MLGLESKYSDSDCPYLERQQWENFFLARPSKVNTFQMHDFEKFWRGLGAFLGDLGMQNEL